jgi:hypothetical protein
MRSDTPLGVAGISQPALAVERSLGLMLDGYGWQPFSREFDYKATRQRVREEVFPRKLVDEILRQ